MDKKNKLNAIGLTEFLDIHFNIFEYEDIDMIIDVTKHLKTEFKNYFYDEFFRIARPEVKNVVYSHLVENEKGFNKEKYAEHVNRAPFKTRNYTLNRMRHGDLPTRDVDGTCFEDLQTAVIETGSPSLIIDFAKNFDCNVELLENTIKEQHGAVYHKAFRMLVLDDKAYHKDDMQMYQ